MYKNHYTKSQQKRLARLARLRAILINEYGVRTPLGRDCNVRKTALPDNIYCAVNGTVAVPRRAISILQRMNALGAQAW